MMKEIRITIQRQKKELKVFVFCFLIAFSINVFSIITYKTNWVEVFSYIGYVFVIAIFLYGLFAIVRIVYYMVLKAFRYKKK